MADEIDQLDSGMLALFYTFGEERFCVSTPHGGRSAGVHVTCPSSGQQVGVRDERFTVYLLNPTSRDE